ncbi:MAG: hypothetical protein AAGK05_10950, partial [Pseudomonadota bacterium]
YGVQVFLPISPIVTLCLYDRKVYKMGSKRDSYTVVTNDSDIYVLNELQFRSREAFIVCRTEAQAKHAKHLCDVVPRNSLYRNHFKSTSPVDAGNDQLKSTFLQWREQMKLKRWLSFCKIKKKARTQYLQSGSRCPEIVQEHRSFVQGMRDSRDVL